ncbi:alpha-amylase family glycosyl hydrolase [Adhaeribacter aquaticus]|uniref:alpha-amylase family glycosyl hydrolase n=1 Tax=Adhaeribacter aquaticus TaxID=299567 RepID=UPI0003F79F0C|nr:alpha-amylase family glycosyl hydrolase [Adhaeribacter aquaticus]
MKTESNKYLWWQQGIIYQIYPRSYQDSNADGVGDLKGIISRLDYIKELGIKAIWVSPVFPSPMADFGYDISDYKNIHPLFGNLNDFDQLLQEVHARDMKLILDFVPNHSSDQHPWFIESRSSRNNPKRDWYIWKDPKPDGSEPNNWQSMFGGSAWQWDGNTSQYYYHSFLKEQPDLNWRNPDVQYAMLDVMRFWFNKGIDGFRIDVLWHLMKDPEFRDNPVNPDYRPGQPSFNKYIQVNNSDGPDVLEVVRRMRMLTNVHKDRVLIGEIYLPLDKLMKYYGQHNKGVHLPFNFLLLSLPWEADKIAASITQYEAALPPNGWPNWVLGNHDQVRIASRVGLAQARIAAMLLLTLRGTPTIYYGDEIGMHDVPIPEEEVQDPQGLNMPELNVSRDPARTPMQWSEYRYAGFSPHKPWLRLPDNYKRLNVSVQEGRRLSMLNLYKRLISFRQKEPALMVGSYTQVYADKQQLAFLRTYGKTQFLVVLNLTHRPCYFKPKDFRFSGKIELATYPEPEGKMVKNVINLSGDEGVIVRLHDAR